MNWKSPVYQALNEYGQWQDDQDGISLFYDYTCETPSGMTIDRSARFFSRNAFLKCLALWNMSDYKYLANPHQMGYPDPNSKAVNERPRED